MTQLPQIQKGINLEVLAKDAAVALIIKFGGVIFLYLLQIFLARWMGKSEYGIYEYVLAWSLLLSVFAGLGLPRTALRLISEYRVKEDWGSLRGIFRGSLLMTLAASLLLSAVAAGIILLLKHYGSFAYAIPLLVGMALIPLQALKNLQLEIARAMDDITLAYAPSEIIWPVLTICGGAFLWEINGSLTSLPAIGLATLVFLFVILLQLWLLGKKLNKEIEAEPPVYSYHRWIGVSLVLLLQEAFFIIVDRTDIIMVGSFIGSEAAGMYNAAVQSALWVTFVLQIFNMVAAPAFATLYTQGDMEGLQKVVSKVTVWIFWPSVLIALFLIVFSQPVLSIFGSDFIAASLSLKILALGRLVGALCGSVGGLMIMTGHQNQALPVFVTCSLINVVGNAIAIHFFGIVGAAVTTSLTLMLWNIWLNVLVVKYIGVRPSIFNSLFNN